MINPLDIIRKYYTLDSLAGQSLLIHSQLVRDKAQSLAIRHPEMDLDIPFIPRRLPCSTTSGFFSRRPRTSVVSENIPTSATVIWEPIYSARKAFPAHALVCERHTGAGISLEMIKENHLPLPQRDMLPVTLEEKLIAFADKFYSKTNLTREKKLGKIRAEMAFYGEETAARFEEWCELFL